MYERDRQTDRHTDIAWRHRSRLCIALRGKNDSERRAPLFDSQAFCKSRGNVKRKMSGSQCSRRRFLSTLHARLLSTVQSLRTVYEIDEATIDEQATVDHWPTASPTQYAAVPPRADVLLKANGTRSGHFPSLPGHILRTYSPPDIFPGHMMYLLPPQPPPIKHVQSR